MITEIIPVEGNWLGTKKERNAACKAAGHPKVYLNLSLSQELGYQIYRCHCGKQDDAPDAVVRYNKQKRQKPSV